MAQTAQELDARPETVSKLPLLSSVDDRAPPQLDRSGTVSDAMASLHALRSAAHAMAAHKIASAAEGKEVPWRALLREELRPMLESATERGVLWPAPSPIYSVEPSFLPAPFGPPDLCAPKHLQSGVVPRVWPCAARGGRRMAEAWMRKSKAVVYRAKQMGAPQAHRMRQVLVDYSNALLILDWQAGRAKSEAKAEKSRARADAEHPSDHARSEERVVIAPDSPPSPARRRGAVNL